MILRVLVLVWCLGAVAALSGCGAATRSQGGGVGHTAAASTSQALWSSDSLGRPVHRAAPRAEDVNDALLALLVGMVQESVYGSLDGAQIDSLVMASGGSQLPYERLVEIVHEPDPSGAPSTLRIGFDGPVDEPVPYSIMGYRPGRVLASEELLLDRWDLGDTSFRVNSSRGPRVLRVEQLQLFGLREGSMEADVDGVVDWILGDQIDDMAFTGFALLRLRGHRYAVAFGYTAEGSGRSGAFDLEEDTLVFPVPGHFLGLGRQLRARMELLQRRHGRQPAQSPSS